MSDLDPVEEMFPSTSTVSPVSTEQTVSFCELQGSDDIGDDGGDDDDDDNDDDVDFVETFVNQQNLETLSSEPDSEKLLQEKFRIKTCGCKSLHNGKPCTDIKDWDELINYRLASLEYTKEELDMIIKVQLSHHRSTGVKTSRKKDRVKPRQLYFFAGHRVCRDLFAFVHGLHRQTVDSIARSLDCKGLEPRHHGNKGKLPAHALTLAQTKAIKSFIDNYALQYGLPLPGRLASFRMEKAKLLPSNKTKNDIYECYCEAASLLEAQTVSLSTSKKMDRALPKCCCYEACNRSLL